MPTRRKYVDDYRVLATKRLPAPDEILVKLRREGSPPQWQRFKLADYQRRVVYREV